MIVEAILEARVLSQQNDSGIKKIRSKFVSYMKNRPMSTTNDKIGIAVVRSIVLPKNTNRLHVITFIQTRVYYNPTIKKGD